VEYTKARVNEGSRRLKFAPRDVFEQMLEYAVIPTFDLVVAYGRRGVIVVRRRIPPYRGVWAVPGLRMMKPEGIDDTIRRIARDELGLTVDPAGKRLLGQYVGRFRSEHGRQDLSTGYLLHADDAQPIRLNERHFSGVRLVHRVPPRTGAMYRFYLERYFTSAERR
jgi:ADP-ribose pyrophosphatase YjhB (NUDIX family)